MLQLLRWDSEVSESIRGSKSGKGKEAHQIHHQEDQHAIPQGLDRRRAPQCHQKLNALTRRESSSMQPIDTAIKDLQWQVMREVAGQPGHRSRPMLKVSLACCL